LTFKIFSHLRLLLKTLNSNSFLIISSLTLLKLIISYSSTLEGATEVAWEGIVVIRVSSRICLKGTGSLQIKEAGVVVKRSFAFKKAFLAFKAAILAFIATSLLLIL
jgi:hypothetical protein